MKTITNVKDFAMRSLAAVALLLSLISVNSACRYILHQPKEPEALLKLKKQ